MTARKLRRSGVATTAVAAVAALSPALASADVESVYHPNDESRNFAASLGGWSGSVEYQGLCIPGLTCPTLTNSHQPSGGAEQDGHLRTGISGLAGVASTSRATWQSPAFTYSGAEGEDPTELSFALAIRSDLSALLSVTGNAATYTVQLADLDSGSAPLVTVIDHQSVAGAQGWTSLAAVPINPSQLTMGHRYAIRIITEFVTGTEIVSGGTVDYDNVRLRAVREGASGRAGGGAGPGGGAGSGGGVSAQFLLGFLRRDGVDHAGLKGNRLFVRVRCPKRATAPCRTRTVGLWKGRRSPRVTKVARKRVKPGQRGLARLHVKPRYRSRVSERKRLLFRRTIAVGAARATHHKRLRIVRR